MRELLSLILICSAVFAVFYFGHRLRVYFVIEIRGGKVVGTKGNVPQQYVEDVERICALWSIDRGRIKAIRAGKEIRVSVGDGIAREHARAFQNAWDYPI